MDDRKFQQREMLRLGRYLSESEPVGCAQLRQDAHGRVFVFSVALDMEYLQYALDTSGVLSLNDLGAPVSASIENVMPRLRAAFCDWMTSTIAWDSHVLSLSDAEFLRLLEGNGHQFVRLLSSRAVIERIGHLRAHGTPRQRRRLATIVAGRTDGRPERLPSDVQLYHLANGVLRDIEALVSRLATARNKRQVWLSVKTHTPGFYAELAGFGLIDKWERRAQRGLTGSRRTAALHRCAEELVAARLGAKPSTITKRVSAVRQRRCSQVTPEFKQRAVGLALEERRSVAAVARELGVPSATLRAWVQQARAKGSVSSPSRTSK